jgi:hypothetical protein
MRVDRWAVRGARARRASSQELRSESQRRRREWPAVSDQPTGNAAAPILLYLLDGREIRLIVDLEEWTSAFHYALAKNESIQVEDPSDQGKLGINPRAVLYWKSKPPPAPEHP